MCRLFNVPSHFVFLEDLYGADPSLHKLRQIYLSTRGYSSQWRIKDMVKLVISAHEVEHRALFQPSTSWLVHTLIALPALTR